MLHEPQFRLSVLRAIPAVQAIHLNHDNRAPVLNRLLCALEREQLHALNVQLQQGNFSQGECVNRDDWRFLPLLGFRVVVPLPRVLRSRLHPRCAGFRAKCRDEDHTGLDVLGVLFDRLDADHRLKAPAHLPRPNAAMGATVDGQLVRATQTDGRPEVLEVVVEWEVVQGGPKKRPARGGSRRGFTLGDSLKEGRRPSVWTQNPRLA